MHSRAESNLEIPRRRLGMTYLVRMAVLFFRIAAALCFLAVALGAFGAHSLKQILEAHGMLDVWNKAVFYHFIHALRSEERRVGKECRYRWSSYDQKKNSRV